MTASGSKTRYIVILLGNASDIRIQDLEVYPGVSVYRIDGPDAEHQIDMALLNDLVCPVMLTGSTLLQVGRSRNY